MILGCDRCVLCERFTGKNVGRLWIGRRQPLLIFCECMYTYMAYMYNTWSFISSIWNRLMAVSAILQLAFALSFRGGLFRTEHIRYYEKNGDRLWNCSMTTTPDISTRSIHVINSLFISPIQNHLPRIFNNWVLQESPLCTWSRVLFCKRHKTIFWQLRSEGAKSPVLTRATNRPLTISVVL